MFSVGGVVGCALEDKVWVSAARERQAENRSGYFRLAHKQYSKNECGNFQLTTPNFGHRFDRK